MDNGDGVHRPIAAQVERIQHEESVQGRQIGERQPPGQTRIATRGRIVEFRKDWQLAAHDPQPRHHESQAEDEDQGQTLDGLRDRGQQPRDG